MGSPGVPLVPEVELEAVWSAGVAAALPVAAVRGRSRQQDRSDFVSAAPVAAAEPGPRTCQSTAGAGALERRETKVSVRPKRLAPTVLAEVELPRPVVSAAEVEQRFPRVGEGVGERNAVVRCRVAAVVAAASVRILLP